MSNKNDIKFKEKDNIISSNFNDNNIHEEIYPIINSNNSIHIPDIINHNIFEDININNPFLDMDEQTLYVDQITNDLKFGKPPPSPPPPE
jgi:hypothetical protein